MSKTNSNSITSILISELNNLESDFRIKMLEKFREYGADIPDELFFYDGTHSPLKLESMGNKEVDIYARIPGKYKIYLMIEVKAGINEDLQDSQKANGEYQKTSKVEKIPLFYIIPKAYIHKNKIEFVENEQLGKIIKWEEILNIANNCKDKRFVTQIKHFVEITIDENYFDEGKNICKTFEVLEEYIEINLNIKKTLDICLKTINDKYFKQSQYEFGYYWNNYNYYLGYNFIKNNYVLSFDIAEDKSNTEIGKNKEKYFYFCEGWYFIPFDEIENEKILTIKDFNTTFQQKYISQIDLNSFTDFQNIDSKKLIDAFIFLKLLNETYENIFKENKDYKLTRTQNNEYGIGAYFDELGNKKRKFFIGISPKLEDKKYWFSLAMELSNIKPKNEWYLDSEEKYAYFPINKEKLINCKSKKDLEEALEQEINNIIANI